MFRFLSGLRPARAAAARPRASAARRRARPRVEALEDRFLPSLSPLPQSPAPSAAQSSSAFYKGTFPNFQGVTFSLSSSDNSYAATVTVQSETYQNVSKYNPPSMTLSGTCVDQSGTMQPFSGTLAYDPAGNLMIHITTSTSELFARLTTTTGYYYSLNGTVSTRTSSGGSVQVSGRIPSASPTNAPIAYY